MSRRTFTKIRKWAAEVGAKVDDSGYSEDRITVTLPSGKQFVFYMQRESTCRRVINRGRGLKWDGQPKGLYMKEVPDKNYGGYSFQEPSQVVCIEKMAKYL